MALLHPGIEVSLLQSDKGIHELNPFHVGDQRLLFTAEGEKKGR